MALKTKSIIDAKESADGLRISIMSRHTLDDGITPDPRITQGSYDEHWLELAPPPRLIGDYYKRGLSWAVYEMRFKEHLNSSVALACLNKLIQLSLQGNVTIMCIEDTPEKCHRRLVAEACRKLAPELEIVIK
jgi:uncharacterized protein YeaO (DUF488 family)